MYQNLTTMEDIIKKKFGYKFNRNQISNIDVIIENLIKNFDNSDIDNFLKNYFYNYRETINYIDKNFSKICV